MQQQNEVALIPPGVGGAGLLGDRLASAPQISSMAMSRRRFFASG
jgi:hypothetical protein